MMPSCRLASSSGEVGFRGTRTRASCSRNTRKPRSHSTARARWPRPSRFAGAECGPCKPHDKPDVEKDARRRHAARRTSTPFMTVQAQKLQRVNSEFRPQLKNRHASLLARRPQTEWAKRSEDAPEAIDLNLRSSHHGSQHPTAEYSNWPRTLHQQKHEVTFAVVEISGGTARHSWAAFFGSVGRRFHRVTVVRFAR